MNTGKYVFSQIVDFLDYKEFNKCVKCYNGNWHKRDLSCWSQFLQLFFGQITSLNSIRMICVCMEAHKGQHYNLGIMLIILCQT
ncbi:MAG: DUF4372 domain-containing protein [Prevotellaceae bacterium]|nr:DUF4372 domain-containing protein [Prevotellaceae bacterium]